MFTFRQNHSSGFIQRRIAYIFVSNSLQESIQKMDILPSFCSDHSPTLFIYKIRLSFNSQKNFWIFNGTLTLDETCMNQI